MSNDKKNLRDYNLSDFSTVTLTDLGPTIPMWLSKVIVYAGVPIIYELYATNHYQIFSLIFEPAYLNQKGVKSELIQWYEPALLTYIRYAMDWHFFTWMIVWFTQHRMQLRNVPISLVLWEVLVYWLGLGVIFGFMLYRPDQEFARSLEDDEYEIPMATLIVLGTIFILA
jgi:hypothetical protein